MSLGLQGSLVYNVVRILPGILMKGTSKKAHRRRTACVFTSQICLKFIALGDAFVF
jgi:hypothetical protein